MRIRLDLSFSRLLGAAFILSGLIVLAVKIAGLPELQAQWQQWAAPESGTGMLVAHIIFDAILLGARLLLGIWLLNDRRIDLVVFYPLALLAALGGVSASALVALAIIHRLMYCRP